MRRLPVWFLIVAAVLLGTMPRIGFAADPQPYAVSLAPTGDAALDKVLHDTSSLISLQKSSPVGGFALTERARKDLDRFNTALHSYGYYKAQIVLTIDGRALDTPDLADMIGNAPASPPIPVAVRFDLGPLFHLGKVEIDGIVPPDARAKLGLAPGQPALAAEVLGAQGRLLAAIREDGYPLAKVDMPPATLRPADNTLDVDFIATTGPPAVFGDIAITGLKNMHEVLCAPAPVAAYGREIQPVGDREGAAGPGLHRCVLGSAHRAGRGTLDAQGRLPLTISLTERPLHAVDAGVAYSTDLGINFNLGWHDRNLFGNAEQLNLTAMMQLGGDAITKPGYQFGAQFIKPDFLRRDQSLEIDLNAVDQSLKAYDQNALEEKISINRKLSDIGPRASACRASRRKSPRRARSDTTIWSACR